MTFQITDLDLSKKYLIYKFAVWTGWERFSTIANYIKNSKLDPFQDCQTKGLKK